MKLTDQLIKLRLVLLVAIFSLIGFFLELGPLGSAFSLPAGGVPIGMALTLQLPALGFLAYLALAASAVVGLHLSETEPTPKEKDDKQAGRLDAVGDGEMAGEAVRVRPELHQARMVFTALGGYVLLKGISLALMWQAAQRYGIELPTLLQAFRFGFFYMAIGWLLMWQFLRWFAQRRRWVRLQDELVGGDITARAVALFLLVKPVLYFFTLNSLALTPLTSLTMLLYLTVVAAAIFLWTARPLALTRTVAGLLTTGAIAIILTIALALIERTAA